MNHETPTFTPTLAPPTERQQVVLNAIRAHWRSEGLGPSFRELMAALGIRNPNGIRCHLVALESKGLIERVPGLDRAVWPAGLRERIRELAA